MTLQEMSVEYRAQAQVLQGRIEALKQTQDTLDHGAARDQMALRIQTCLLYTSPSPRDTR